MNRRPAVARGWIAAALLLVPLAACRAASGPPPAPASFAPPPGPRERAERERFLAERLDAGRLHAQAWQWGWTAFNGVSTAYSAVEAAGTNDHGERAYQVVQAVNAALGLADVWLLEPMPGREGAAAMRRGDPATSLARGEQLLLASAARARARRGWRLRLENLALQTACAGVLLAFDEPRLAAFSFASGMAGGELYLWSQPWRPERDLHDYERLVRGTTLPGDPAPSLTVAPAPGGLALRLGF